MPTIEQWRDAAAHVRANRRERDAIKVAPAWADPILRWVLGDRISLADAGASDLDAYQRLWTLAIRGARPADAPRREPDFSRRYGRVELLRWDLGQSEVLYDLVKEVKSAEVTMVRRGSREVCPLLSLLPASGGGLGQGVLPPRELFACDSPRPWLWVAPVVMENMSLEPRYCVWQHPAGKEPIRVSYRDVPLGEWMRFYGGLYYEHERDLKGGPVKAVIRIDGKQIAEMIHRDGDGWKALSAPTRESTDPRKRGEITIEVTAPRPHERSFCWAASVRRGSQTRGRR